MMLGLRKEDDVFVIDSSDFPDSMTTVWDSDKISALLSSAFAPHLSSKSKSKQPPSDSAPPTATIDALVTFDAGGVSGHPNHVSLYHGARSFVYDLVHGKSGWQPPVDLYTLTSVPVLRKYMGILDVLATLVNWALRVEFKNKQRPNGLVFFNGVGSGGIVTAWKAMTTAHKSQMRWFRYGWISFSRYMVMNDLRLEKVKTR
jgi:N-acetylglucosaminylphosphatidylinositol deacetylase